MSTVVEPMRADSRDLEQLAALFAEGWPAFIAADEVAAERVPRVRAAFEELELALLVDGELTAAGWGVPLAWSGRVDDLPTGYTDSLGRALADAEAGARCDTLVVCAVQVRQDRQGRGLAGQVLAALVERAGASGLSRVVAPLRPARKSRYPLTPIQDYAAWVRADGSAFDPWLRTHLRMGATVLGTSPASQTMTGTIAQWEGWTGLALPGSGAYVVPDALAPLTVDHPADRGTCTEPAIWVRHR